MSEYITLLGAEKVERAGHNMASAAETMRMAALQTHEDMERQRQFMDDWLARLEAALEARP